MSKTLQAYFAPQGALSRLLPDYQVREGQQKLAEAVFSAIDSKRILLGEAGTGTGKTFAYLLPLLASGKKALVSTATKNLQEQIFTHDLPLVRKLIPGRRVALLKGRRNYLCHYHYENWHAEQTGNNAEVKRVEKFVETTKDGDLSQLAIPETSDIHYRISSTAENCLGRQCEFFEQCYVQQARQAAKEADLVVVNHHLLLADFALKADGFAEILPDIEAFVIDEAHHLPQIAVNFLGERLSHRQLTLLLEDIHSAVIEEAPDAQLSITPMLTALNLLLGKINTLLATTPIPVSTNMDIEGQRIVDGDNLTALNDFWAELAQLGQDLASLATALNLHRERGKLLAKAYERLNEQITQLADFCQHREAQTDNHRAQWLAISRNSFILHSVPVNAAGRFRYWIEASEASWVFLSATLAVNEKFDHFRRELGLTEESVDSVLLGSPFDYRMQSILYHPDGLPDPNHPNYTAALMDKALPLLKLSRGRAFLLFTSYRAMNMAYKCLENTDFVLFKQGDMPKNQLLQRFRQTDNALLLATASFWEGVDVRGDRLVCVLIDKLPFSAPNDPIAKTKHRLLQEKGLTPFIHDTLPQAVITLKQGVGRLIRDHNDYGVLLIGDPRLTQKSYGKVFLDSLPRMTRTRDPAVLQRFFSYHENSNAR